MVVRHLAAAALRARHRTSPGLLLGGAPLPINYDAFTGLVLAAANTPSFAGFAGALDGRGRAQAAFAVPALPFATGLRAHFAYALWNPWNTASNPVAVRFSP